MNRPPIEDVKYLMAVANHANFTRAAEALHISQPTLSQQIKQLERILGVQLLDRTGRVVRLTDAGTVYSEHARRILRDLAAGERAVNDVQDLSRGHLRLGLTPTFTAYLIGPLTAEFNTRHPGITLAIQEMSQDRIEAALLAGELDLGIAFAGSHLPGITARSWFTEVLSLVTCTTNRQSMPKILPVKALETTELALLSEDFATRNHIDAYFARHDIAPRITVEATSIQALTEIVQRSPLATVLPEAITHDHLQLAPVPIDPPFPARTAALLRRQGAYESAVARAFSEAAYDFSQTRGYDQPPFTSGSGD